MMRYMVKKFTQKLQLILFFIVSLGISNHVIADNIKWSAFSLYEHASDRIKLDGVSTRYGIGAAGIEAQIQSPNITQKISLRYGFGYHPSYSIRSSGTEFTGPVTGNLFEVSIQSAAFRNMFEGTNIGFKISNRRIHSNDLRGIRGGIEYVSTSDANMMAFELTIAKELKFSSDTFLTPFIGMNHWNLSATGNAYSSNLTIKKTVRGGNIDPIAGLSFNTKINGQYLNLGLTYRSLKADEPIDTLELFAAYSF